MDYTTSNKSFNHKKNKNLSYSCFVNNCTLNITPLSRFLIPPPMSEKKIVLDKLMAFLKQKIQNDCQLWQALLLHQVLAKHLWLMI